MFQRIDKFSGCLWRSSFQFAVTVEDLFWRKPVSCGRAFLEAVFLHLDFPCRNHVPFNAFSFLEAL